MQNPSNWLKNEMDQRYPLAENPNLNLITNAERRAFKEGVLMGLMLARTESTTDLAKQFEEKYPWGYRSENKEP